MKKLNYWIAALGILFILLLFPIVLPIISQEQPADVGEDGLNSPKIIQSSQLVFDLQYEKYRIPYPYQYKYKDEIRTFEFREMIRMAEVAREEFDQGQLTYISNYKDENGKAPLYFGKTTDKDGTLRGAAAPAYKNINQPAEFDYIPDGTLVRVIEKASVENPEFAKVYVINDREEYFVPIQYIKLDRNLNQLKKVIVVDLKNQTIGALEKSSRRVYYPASNTLLKTDWEIVSYSKCTTGMLGIYQQPTPKGFFYAIEKKPYFDYLKDGTNIIGGREPWAIRFTAGAYIHGMSLGEYSSAIGTVPLSHKCVRNYTSHAKFLYEWFEEDETVVIVI